MFTIVYVVKDATESLLGLKDAKALSIIQINPVGRQSQRDVVRQLYDVQKPDPKIRAQSTGQGQREIEEQMEQIIRPHEQVFTGIGVAKVDPVHIEIDKSVKPVQQKRRPIALHYMEKFKEHIEELHKAGVVSGPLKSESAIPIPTPQELRHSFAGSDRYSVVDLNHSFHQFSDGQGVTRVVSV